VLAGEARLKFREDWLYSLLIPVTEKGGASEQGDCSLEIFPNWGCRSL
jgi:hypothetical protein